MYYSNCINLPRGNTRILQITPTKNGSPHTLADSDTVIFTLKSLKPNSKIIFEKIITTLNYDAENRLLMRLNPADTANLQEGRYCYDVALLEADGDFFTFIKPTDFIISAVCTEPPNSTGGGTDELQVVSGELFYPEVITLGGENYATKLQLQAETNRATSAENELRDDLQFEIERASDTETVLQGDLTTEIERATSAENELQSNIDTEIERAVTEILNYIAENYNPTLKAFHKETKNCEANIIYNICPYNEKIVNIDLQITDGEDFLHRVYPPFEDGGEERTELEMPQKSICTIQFFGLGEIVNPPEIYLDMISVKINLFNTQAENTSVYGINLMNGNPLYGTFVFTNNVCNGLVLQIRLKDKDLILSDGATAKIKLDIYE
jgi:hypothetical protein